MKIVYHIYGGFASRLREIEWTNLADLFRYLLQSGHNGGFTNSDGCGIIYAVAPFASRGTLLHGRHILDIACKAFAAGG